MSNILRTLQKYARQGGNGGGFNPNPSGLGNVIAAVAGIGALSYATYYSLYTVNGGHRAVVFNRIGGVSNEVIPEGTHIRVPWFETPTIFDIRAKPKIVKSTSGTRDLQMVEVGLRVLFRPKEKELPQILSELGTNYDERVMPSIVNETLKSVIAQFNASQLITQRETVSQRIKQQLEERAIRFHIAIDDVSVTHLNFSKDYSDAVEAKQIAQQEAERAKYIVKQAEQDKKSTIIKAQGEARSAEMIGAAVQQNPGYLELRRLDAARDIATTVAKSGNKVYLDSSSLLLNILDTSSSTNTNTTAPAPKK